MKRLIRVFLSKFMDNDCYYVFGIESSGFTRFVRTSGTKVTYRSSGYTEVSLTRRQAYVLGKINFKGEVYER